MIPEIMVSAVALEGKKCRHQNGMQHGYRYGLPSSGISKIVFGKRHNYGWRAQGRISSKISLRENILLIIVKDFKFVTAASKAATATRSSFANVINFSYRNLVFLVSL